MTSASDYQRLGELTGRITTLSDQATSEAIRDAVAHGHAELYRAMLAVNDELVSLALGASSALAAGDVENARRLLELAEAHLDKLEGRARGADLQNGGAE